MDHVYLVQEGLEGVEWADTTLRGVGIAPLGRLVINPHEVHINAVDPAYGMVMEGPGEATPHDAIGDILVLEELFKRIYDKFKENGVDEIESEMIRISNSPVLVSRMPFGKHKGTLFSDIPMDYLEWLHGAPDLDEDLEFTVRYYLGLIEKDQIV